MRFRLTYPWMIVMLVCLSYADLAHGQQQAATPPVTWSDHVIACGGTAPTGDAFAAMATLALSGRLRETEVCLDNGGRAVAHQASKEQAIPYFERLLNTYPDSTTNWTSAFEFLGDVGAKELTSLSALVPDFASQAAKHLGGAHAKASKAHANFCHWTTLSSASSFALKYCWPGDWVTHVSNEVPYCVYARDVLYYSLPAEVDSEMMLRDARSAFSCHDSVSSKYHSALKGQAFSRGNVRLITGRANNARELTAWLADYPDDMLIVNWYEHGCRTISAVSADAQTEICALRDGQIACSFAIVCAQLLDKGVLVNRLMDHHKLAEQEDDALVRASLRYATRPPTGSNEFGTTLAARWLCLPLLLLRYLR